jgi:hypothetical protein
MGIVKKLVSIISAKTELLIAEKGIGVQGRKRILSLKRAEEGVIQY